jgi:hypothetical protein
VTKVKYFRPRVGSQNSINGEIKRRLNSGYASYYSVQNFLSSCLLFKNVKIKIYRALPLPIVSYGCETWSVMLREEHYTELV